MASGAARLRSSVGMAFFGYRDSLRPAQEDAIPPILAGHDTLVLAGTGSGKTEAVLAPAISRHIDDTHESHITWLYISPTRALANDLLERVATPLANLNLLAGAQHAEKRALSWKRPADLLITTPESFDIAVTANHPALAGVRAVVLDEIHQLANTQRGKQVGVVIGRLEERLGRPLQVLGMSATVSDPLAMWHTIRPSSSPVVIEDPTPRGREYLLRRLSDPHKISGVLKATAASDKVLVFVRSRRDADQLAAGIGMDSGFGDRVFVHHSAIAKGERERVEAAMRERERAICFATSTLELGIDIGDVNLVVLTEPTTDWKSFLQRIGRGNRRSDGPTQSLLIAGARDGRSLVDAAVHCSTVNLVEDLSAVSEGQGVLYGALAQQACELVDASPGGWIGTEALLQSLSGASGTDQDTLRLILSALVDQEYLKWHPVHPRVGRGAELDDATARGEIWSNFPEESSTIEIRSGHITLAHVPAGNLALLRPGATFPMQGRMWNVVSVSSAGARVAPGKGPASIALRFSASAPAADAMVIDGIHDVWRQSFDGLRMSGGTLRWWDDAVARIGPISRKRIRYFADGAELIFVTLAGSVVNKVILDHLGLTGQVSDTAIRCPEIPAFSSLPDSIESLADSATRVLASPAQLTVWQHRLPPDLLWEELASEWLRRPAHQFVLDRLRHAELRLDPDERLRPLVGELR